MPDDTTTTAGPSIRRVGLVAKSHLQAAANLLAEIASWLVERGVQPVFDTDTARLARAEQHGEVHGKDDLPRHVDMVLVLGGDGTLLGMADRIAQTKTEIPILGVNFGSLGFLTEITLPELYPSLESALSGSAQIDERLMLEAHTTRRGEPYVDRVALNDVVITKGALSRIIDLSVSVGTQFVARFKADGLIVASATGSTAYNMAAGGPIVHPVVDALVITPIAPHTLTNRPIVIPASAEVSVQPLIDESNEEIYITFDGQFGFELTRDDIVTVNRAARPLKLIRASTRTYFEVLRQKLKWAER
ncbi:MAG: NAD(+)/NADH kinase [Acidobacteria bacterium]|nr:NAD(+)/NADH kinase [Acidobacteriota bacterium]